LQAANAALTPRAWQVFDTAIDTLQGQFSPSEFEVFGFESQQALRPYVVALEDNGIVVSTREDHDKRLKTVVITSKGWLLKYARTASGS
jgi:DNA-binding MarR family transcriptional regulator